VFPEIQDNAIQRMNEEKPSCTAKDFSRALPLGDLPRTNLTEVPVRELSGYKDRHSEGASQLNEKGGGKSKLKNKPVSGKRFKTRAD